MRSRILKAYICIGVGGGLYLENLDLALAQIYNVLKYALADIYIFCSMRLLNI